jgi:hypothetical protein
LFNLRESIEQLIKDNSSPSSTQLPQNRPQTQSSSASSSSSSTSFNNTEFPNSLASFVESTYNLKPSHSNINNNNNINSNNQMKMLGDVSSMVSLLAAAAAAASSSAASSSSTNKQQQGFTNTSFQFNPSQMQLLSPNSISYDFNNSINSQSAALAAIQKYNSLYSNMQQQQQQQQQHQQSQLQQSYLTKYMSFCYNKPTDYIQKLLAEQNSTFLKETGLNSPTDVKELASNLINHQQKGIFNPTSYQAEQHQQKTSNAINRYHPYKNNNANNTKVPITVITNGSEHSLPLNVHSPTPLVSIESDKHLKKLSLINKNIYSHPGESRSPSPISSAKSSPVQKSKEDICSSNSRPPSTPSLTEAPNSPNLKKKT